MERGIYGICSQFCLAAACGFRQFCGAGRGGARPAFRGAGRASIPDVNLCLIEKEKVVPPGPSWSVSVNRCCDCSPLCELSPMSGCFRSTCATLTHADADVTHLMLRIVPRVCSFSRLPRTSVSRCSLELPGILPWSLTI